LVYWLHHKGTKCDDSQRRLEIYLQHRRFRRVV